MTRTVPAVFSGEVSRHRPLIYGFSALWILFFHMTSRIPSRGALAVLAAFQNLGNCGVEIFLLLTGFGLYTSLSRRPGAGEFYLRRLRRVLLPACIVLALYGGFTIENTRRYIAYFTLVSFFTGDGPSWFVPFILLMYLVYPLLFRLQKKRPRALWALFALSVAAMILLESCRVITSANLLRAVSRVPVFLLGCVLAPTIDPASSARPRGFWLTIALGIAAAVLCVLVHPANSVVYWIQAVFYWFVGIAAIQLLTLLAAVLPRLRWPGRFAYRFLAFCGGISLECYLLFGRMKSIVGALLPGGISARTLRVDWLAALCTLLVGFLLTRLCAALTRAFGEIRIPE